MPWFRLEDSFHSHPKVIAAGNEAAGLFVRCGTYAAQHLTDGFIREDVALLYGSAELAATLVREKLWHRARGGWRIHDYLDYNPSREQVLATRHVRAEAGRQGGIASGRSRHNRDKALDQLLTNDAGTNTPVDNSLTGDSTTGDQRKPRSNHEANASPLASGLLAPPARPVKDPPNPPQAGGSAHDGSHPNCRACGTNQRGPAPPPAVTPMPPPVGDVLPNGKHRVASEDVAPLLAQTRQAITRKDADA